MYLAVSFRIWQALKNLLRVLVALLVQRLPRLVVPLQPKVRLTICISMCITPITIKNPMFGHSGIGLSYLHDTTSSSIKVPCGHCVQCVSLRQGFYSQRIQMESLRSHLFMFTLTYNNESLVYVDCGEYHLPIPYLPDIQFMFKRIRALGYKIRYSYVTEYGTKKGSHRPHFHGILAIEKDDRHYSVVEREFSNLFRREWRRNIATTIGKKGKFKGLPVVNTRSPIWQRLFTSVYRKGRERTFDFHYIEPIRGHEDDVSFYVSKYITKYDSRTYKLLQKIKLDPSLSDEETKDLISLIKPRCITSKDFGSYDFPAVRSYIDECIAKSSSSPIPQFYDLYTGKSMMLSRYYCKHLGFDYLYSRWLDSDMVDDLTNVHFDDSCTLEQLSRFESSLSHQARFKKNLAYLEKKFAD